METVKQLGYCNAYVLTSTNGACVTHSLISYCTKVARVVICGPCVLRVELGQAAHCSATTSKHVLRFLREYAPGFEFVASKQLDGKHGYDYYDEICYSNLNDLFERGTYYFTNNPDETPYKDFYSDCGFLVRGLRRG